MFGGRKIKNRYVIESLIHRGSVSSVYLVSDLEVPGRKYILKQIVDTKHNPAERNLAEFLFLKEIDKLKEIRHDGIARVYDGFVESGRFFILQEHIEGSSLASIIDLKKPTTFSSREIFEYLQQVCDIIMHLNLLPDDKQIFRDIRPESFVLTSEGRIYLVDCGLSRVFLPIDELMVKLKDYNSPEVSKRGKYTEASDIYAISGVFYYLLTGKVPGGFNGKPPRADKFNNKLAKPLSKLLEECMEPLARRIPALQALKDKVLEASASIEDNERQERIRQEELRLTKTVRAARMRTLIFAALVVAVSIPLLLWGYKYFALNRCTDNCRKLESALKNYAAEHSGAYPEKLSNLIPTYIKKIPSCPAKWKDTYSARYKSYSFPGLKYCRFYCCGNNHAFGKTSEDFPRYNSYDGVMIAPGKDFQLNPVEKLLEAYSLDDKGDYEGAANMFRDLTVMDEKILREKAGIEKYIVFWNMARVLEKMKKKEEAKQKYRTASYLLLRHNLYSFNKTIITLLIQDLRRLGEGSFALHFFNKLAEKYVMERQSPQVNVVSDMVDIYEKLGKKSFAIVLLRKFHCKAPDNEKVFVSAEIYRLKGLRSKAKSTYNRYVHLRGARAMYERAVQLRDRL